MSAPMGSGGIVVLGHPRSGTTLLRRLLDAHPAFAVPGETHLLGAAARFLAADETAAGTDMGVLAGLAFAGFEEAEVLARLRALCFGFLEEQARRQGKPRWGEKTAFDIFEAEAIERLCGDAVHYVGIVRHPLDVAVSCKEFCDAAGTFPAVLHGYLQRWPQWTEAFVHSWLDAAERLMALGRRQPGRCLLLRYEDLVEEPAGVMADLLAFVGADSDTAFLEGALQRRENLGFSDHKNVASDQVHRFSVERWRGLPQAQIARLAPLLEERLRDFGYPPVEAGAPVRREEARRHYLLGLGAAAGRGSER